MLMNEEDTKKREDKNVRKRTIRGCVDVISSPEIFHYVFIFSYNKSLLKTLFIKLVGNKEIEIDESRIILSIFCRCKESKLVKWR